MPSSGAVQSIERAFALLRAVATGPAGISELARRVTLPTSTVARLLSTLEGIGAVERLGDGITYRVGSAVSGLAAAVDRGASLADRARPFLVELVARVGETAGVSVLDGTEVLYLDHVESENQVQVRSWTGTRLPLHVVSSGLVLLAYQPQTFIDDVVRGTLARFTRSTISSPDAVRSRLLSIREEGHCWTAREFDDGITSVAVPIMGPTGVIVGALHVHGPAYRFPAVDTAESTVAALMATARRFEAQLRQ